MRVAVVIPCFNVADYVGDAIESALNQGEMVHEVILVDNGSSDQTVDILKDYHYRFPKVIHWLKEEKRGASLARNTGWRASKADWFQFLDADDILSLGKIHRQLALAREAGSEWVIGTPVYQNLEGDKKPLTPWQDLWKGLAHGMHIGQTSANLYARKALENIDGWQGELPFTQDVDLAFRLLTSRAPVVPDHQESCIVRDRAEGKITQQDPIGILSCHVELRQRLNDYLQKEQPDYWLANEVFFRMAMYRFIRMLATHDPETAARLFDQYMPKGFDLSAQSALKIPFWDTSLVNLFGIERFAKTRNKIKSWLPSQIWQGAKALLP